MDVQAGDRDGAIGASYLPEREAIGAFPMDGQGKPDPAKRISIEGYYLYTLKDSDIDWNGQALSHGQGPIAVKINASITAKLKSLNIPVIEVNSGWDALFEMVISHHAQATAMLSDRGDRILIQNKELSDQIRKIPIALDEKPYYVMLSHQLRATDTSFTDEVWKTIEVMRESP